MRNIKNRKIIKSYVLLVFLTFFSSYVLRGQEGSFRNLFSLNHLVGTDQLGRTVEVAYLDSNNKKYVGVFYSLWLGQHQSGQKNIYDIQKLLDEDEDSLKDAKGNAKSPMNEFHFWGEPLYGYYNMADPWVVTRHIELLTNASIDYLCIDATNNVVYEASTINLLKHLQKFQKQGFKVPKVVFYTNSYSGLTVDKLYSLFYKGGEYDDVWFKPNGKPLIIGITEANHWASDQTRFQETLFPETGFQHYIKPEMKSYFEVKESEWPNGVNNPNAIPWMSWQWPQWNHQGAVAVPVAQHSHSVIYASSLSPECSRGYNNKTKLVESNWKAGANFQTMWEGVFESDTIVNNVLVTSFNEWMAIKYANEKEVFFVDVYNHEYSRDIEMMKGGYEDNFYLQLVKNVRQYKFTPKTLVLVKPVPMVRIRKDNPNDPAWEQVVHRYLDLEGDAIPRDFENASGTERYTDASNRNDIVEVKVAHDEWHVYFRIKTKDQISTAQKGDLKWMNILIKTEGKEGDFAGYNYIINRKPKGKNTSIEVAENQRGIKQIGKASLSQRDNFLQIAIPMKSLNLDPKSCRFEFKVADNVNQPEDIMDYYVSGDAAPLGRLNYAYGY